MVMCQILDYPPKLCKFLSNSTLDARGFLRDEPWNGNKRSGEERENREDVRKPLVTRDSWSYCTNRFELGSRSDPASWLEEPYRCVVIGCLLINLVMLIDSYRSTIVRFASGVTRGFLSPFLCHLIFSLQWNKTSGTRVVKVLTQIPYLPSWKSTHLSTHLSTNFLRFVYMCM